MWCNVMWKFNTLDFNQTSNIFRLVRCNVMSNRFSLSLPPLMYLSLSVRCRFRHAVVTSAARRHHRRRLLKYSPDHSHPPTPPPAIFKLSDDSLQITLKSPSSSLQKLETKLNQFLDVGREALDDLRTIVAVDGNTGGVVISCRRSTVEFLTALLISSFVLVVAVRSLFKIRKSGGEELVYRRDRSLGGREVVVSKRETGWSTSRTSTPLSSENAEYYNQNIRNKTNSSTRRRKEELPQWWPQLVNQGPVEIDNKEGYQKLANQLIQG